MTDANADNLDALVTAYVYGELSADAKAAFEEQMRADPQLQAEVDGLMAMRDVLDADAQFGRESGLEDPPPHLFDAILKDEAIARSPAVKAAVAKRNAPPSEGLLSKLSTWLVGGGALAGAAAVLFYVVARPGSAGDLAAPMAKNEAPAATQSAAPAGMESNADQPVLQGALEEKASASADGAKMESPKPDSAPAEERRLAKGALQDPARPTTIGSGALADREDSLATGRRGALGQTAGGGGMAPEPERKKSDKKRVARRAFDNAQKERHRGVVDVLSETIEADKTPEEKQGERRSEGQGDGDLGLAFGGHKVGIDTSLDLGDDVSASTGDEDEEAAPRPKPKAKPAPIVARDKAEVGGADRQRPSSQAKDSSKAVASSSSRRGAAAEAPASSAAPAEPPAAAPPPPPPPADAAAGPPRLDAKTSEYARKQREAAAKKAPKKVKRSKNKRDDFKANAKREARLRRVEQTIMAAATELSAQRSATALALFQRAELEGSGLKEIGLGPVLGQMQALMQMNRKKEALALARKGERASKGTIGKDDVIATGARVATELQNRPRARSLWRQLLNSPRFKAEAKRGIRALEFDADMFESEAPAVRSRR